MSISSYSRLRIAGGFVLGGLLIAATVPAAVSAAPGNAPLASCAAPILNLANPNPGDMLVPGAYDVEGVAFDPLAQQASGIDQVAIFLDAREAGGIDLGQAIPGNFVNSDPDNPLPVLPSPDAFRLVVTLPAGHIGEHDLVAYAHSTLSGRETMVSVPIVLGEDPAKAGLLPGTSSEFNSNPGSTPTNCSTSAAVSPTSVPGSIVPSTPATPSPVVTPMPATVTTPGAAQPITLEVANPNPGDTLVSGAYVLSGVARDPAALSGSGIDRISIFLDDRDHGGIDLLDVTPTSSKFTITVSLPASHLGAHNLVLYAHSAVSGGEASVSVPIALTQ